MNKIIEKLLGRLQSDSESYKTASVDARNNRGDSFDEQYFLGKMDYAIDLYDWLKDQLELRNKIYLGGFADIGYVIIKEKQNRILELQQQLKDLLSLPVNLRTRIRKEGIEKELSKLEKEDQDENTNK